MGTNYYGFDEILHRIQEARVVLAKLDSNFKLANKDFLRKLTDPDRHWCAANNYVDVYAEMLEEFIVMTAQVIDAMSPIEDLDSYLSLVIPGLWIRPKWRVGAPRNIESFDFQDVGGFLRISANGEYPAGACFTNFLAVNDVVTLKRSSFIEDRCLNDPLNPIDLGETHVVTSATADTILLATATPMLSPLIGVETDYSLIIEKVYNNA
jgi:hypothetical protein